MEEKASETKGRADHIDHLVSKRLRMRRMLLGLSQHELGEAATVSIQQVQKYEKAINRISSGKLYSFAKFLKVPISYFFNQAEDHNNFADHVFSEDESEYNAHSDETNPNEKATEKEVVSLIKGFVEIKNEKIRKKLIEFVKTLS